MYHKSTWYLSTCAFVIHLYNFLIQNAMIELNNPNDFIKYVK
jgi:hypothetical protein